MSNLVNHTKKELWKDGKWWAEEFMRTMAKNSWVMEDIDVDLMLGWFANAQMWMYDQVSNDNESLRKRNEELEAVLAAAKHVVTPDLNEHYLSMAMSELADAIATLDKEE